ncbi:hypothetical protein BJ741DRAFT_610097 [Chytriomyces cf. hyalinus JEL632]|nr:hypothetical protein BJ741DRAFT_610097 [Chytriomyces cf. hyalinus JEL632]
MTRFCGCSLSNLHCLPALSLFSMMSSNDAAADLSNQPKSLLLLREPSLLLPLIQYKLATSFRSALVPQAADDLSNHPLSMHLTLLPLRNHPLCTTVSSNYTDILCVRLFVLTYQICCHLLLPQHTHLNMQYSMFIA